MKILKRIGVALLVLIFLGLIAGILGFQWLKPDYDGVKTLPGLQSQVDVYFDPFGIPHIYAEEEADAFRALGYVHAQDRLWQMELLRRVAPGRLSQVFGKDLLATDKFFLSLGIADASRETVANLDPGSQEVLMAQAYLDGINQYIEEGATPLEFLLTGLEKTPFTLTDIHNAIGYMAFSFAMAHKTDPLLSRIADSLGVEYLQDLEVGYDSVSTLIRNYQPPAGQMLAPDIPSRATAALNALPVPQFIGSNSWVLGPGKTKTGKVILANDPHIGFAQPSVWYEAHIQVPGYENYGYHLAGIPFPLMAHNRKLAYGLTMFENDDINFYYETQNPADSTQYKTPDGWKNYVYHTARIPVKDSDEVVFNYKSSRNGPVMNGRAEQLNAERDISMSWVYTKRPNQLLKVLYRMGHAGNMTEFSSALPWLHAPGLNVMYGDADGNIAWWASAHLWKSADSVNTMRIGEGSEATDTLDYFGFAANPKAINPPWNYVYSANNQPEPVGGNAYPGYYLPENRARRIVEILESKDDWDIKSSATMILDDTSPVNPEIVIQLAKALDIKRLEGEEIELLDKLNKWSGNYSLKMTEPSIFHRWIYYFLKYTFEDELGEEGFEQFLNTHFHKRIIAPLAARDSSVWWDDITTPDLVETNRDIILKAFSSALQSLEADLGKESQYWTWERLHTLEHEHPMGRVEALRSTFNVGPYPMRGSREVINNMNFKYGKDKLFKISSGPSTRRLIDFSDIENSLSILPTGQSGNPFSPHYKDQADMYSNGKFRKMLLNREEIVETSTSLLIFKTSN